MKRIVVFQHVAHEILGTLHPLLRQERFRIRHVNFGRHPDATVDMSKYDGMVVLGGPMGVYEADRFPHLDEEMRCLREALAAEKPVLGICLGAQLLAKTLGAEVTAGCGEVGWYDVELTDEGKEDPVLRSLAPSQRIFQWHGDSFRLPKGATWLATSAKCPYQAFRYGKSAYGFQFHLEVDEPMIEKWLCLLKHREAFNPAERAADEARIRCETAERIMHSMELSRAVFSNYIRLFSTKRRVFVLGSHRTT